MTLQFYAPMQQMAPAQPMMQQPGAQAPTNKFCAMCGTPLAADTYFCPNCGAKIN